MKPWAWVTVIDKISVNVDRLGGDFIVEASHVERAWRGQWRAWRRRHLWLSRVLPSFSRRPDRAGEAASTLMAGAVTSLSGRRTWRPDRTHEGEPDAQK